MPSHSGPANQRVTKAGNFLIFPELPHGVMVPCLRQQSVGAGPNIVRENIDLATHNQGKLEIRELIFLLFSRFLYLGIL